MTAPQADLPALLAYWQRQLRLQDWDIDIEVVRPGRIPGRGGQVSVNADTRHATILIVDPAQAEQDLPAHHLDIEVTLVHELMHVALSATIETHDQLEPAIDSTARALVALNRGERR